MANIPIVTFSGGEYSPQVDARSDVEKYLSGCRHLENMFPRIYGGAERRPGTKYIYTAKNSPEAVILVPFIYSAEIAYVIEFGDYYARFYYDGAILTIGDEPVEIETPYAVEDLLQLQYKQLNDVMWRVHSDYAPRKLVRTTATSFSIDEIEFKTGPFLLRNDLIDPEDLDTSTMATDVYEKGTIGTLTCSEDFFDTDHIGALFKLVHARIDTIVKIEKLRPATGYSSAIDVKETFQFRTHGSWKGIVILERNENNAGWESYRTYRCDKDENTQLTVTEDADNVQYRINVSELTEGIIKAEITVNKVTKEGIVRIDSIASATQAGITVIKELAVRTITGISKATRAVVTCADHKLIAGQKIAIFDVGGMTEVDGFYTVGTVLTTDTFRLRNEADTAYINSSGYTAYTSGGKIMVRTRRWAEGAWSDFRGFPCSMAFFGDRAVYGGTVNNPTTVWLSRTSDYEHFTEGDKDDDSFSLMMSSSNAIRWIEALESLCVGTSGDEWKIGTSKIDTALTPTNFSIRQQSVRGSSTIQAVRANNAILFIDYVERKVREFIFNADYQKYFSPDLTELAEHITESGITTIAHQKNPDSILWCTLDDGSLISMVYEREQNVIAWSKHPIDGTVHSVCVIPSSEEDEIWISITREINGSDATYIEQVQPRDWGTSQADCFFVDSGVKSTETATADITSVIQYPTYLIVNAAAHGFSNGDFIYIEDLDGDFEVLNDQYYQVSDVTTDTFRLKTFDGTRYVVIE